ncbi:hypothetical protein LG3211_2180 [Lysobacter gummosus]|nr:hypothetical protein LG3211_2180 [Lysobacter gummosus]
MWGEGDDRCCRCAGDEVRGGLNRACRFDGMTRRSRAEMSLWRGLRTFAGAGGWRRRAGKTPIRSTIADPAGFRCNEGAHAAATDPDDPRLPMECRMPRRAYHLLRVSSGWLGAVYAAPGDRRSARHCEGRDPAFATGRRRA